ncbi:UpxY family transcription antiterminator [Tenacibaculum agarivorans]|uniref:UpxY family transcription antiterminator n=1 Tax=Tenacibaculum agarivorans TaxID=1908389 RepID=UPI00094B92D9|nr:UpxY family transcription antiterminator [Tenacibaculum agarivorans]
MKNYANGWHVLYVRSRWEKRVFQSLIEIGLEAFLPQITKIQQWSDRKKKVTQPLLPSYVFVYLNSPTELYRALSVSGACKYICFGKDYARVTETEIERLKFMINDENISDIESSSRVPKIGEIKRIMKGPLCDFECEVLRVNNLNKVVVRLDSLQQNFIATVPTDYFCEVGAYA